MKKRLPEILCMAAVLVGLLALAVQAGAEQTHRAYLYGYPDGTIRPEAEVSRAAFAAFCCGWQRMSCRRARRVRFWDVPGTSWAYAAVTRLAGLGLLPFGSDGWFRPDAGAHVAGLFRRAGQARADGGRARGLPGAGRGLEREDAGRRRGGRDRGRGRPYPRGAGPGAQQSARPLPGRAGRAAARLPPGTATTRTRLPGTTQTSSKPPVDHTCRLLPQGEQWTAIG